MKFALPKEISLGTVSTKKKTKGNERTEGIMRLAKRPCLAGILLVVVLHSAGIN